MAAKRVPSVEAATKDPLSQAMVSLYDISQMSMPQISRQLGVPKSRVRLRLLALGCTLRSPADGTRLRVDAISRAHKGVKRLPFTEAWKDNISKSRLAWGEKNARGWRITSNGYVEFTRGAHKGRLEHDVIMEAHIGRRIEAGEVVHHKDEQKLNNNFENLELMTKEEHTRLHRVQDIMNGINRERLANGRFR